MQYADRLMLVRNKVETVMAKASALYGLDMSKVQVRFDLRGRSAGQAGCRRIWGGGTSDHYLRFNVDMIAGDGFDHVYNETVPHEIAHIVCYMNPMLGADHNPGWKRVCRTLGGTGERCHSEEVVYAKGNTYTYITTRGASVNISQQRHRKIQQGHVYGVRGKGELNQFCKWSHYVAAAHTVAAPVVTAPATAAPVEAPRVAEPKPTGGTKADRVRALIALGKSTGKDQAAVVAAVVSALGMNKTLARTYVKNNWDRV